MKEILIQYASYNLWANQRLIDCIKPLPKDWQVKEFACSFPSLQATLLHMWDAEYIWWQRLQMQEVIVKPSLGFKGSLQEVSDEILHQNRLWASWIDGADLLALEFVFHYQNTKGEQFRQPVYQMLLHVFNHGTYHRGQLVGLLRQLELQNIPATDFIVFSRQK